MFRAFQRVFTRVKDATLPLQSRSTRVLRRWMTAAVQRKELPDEYLRNLRSRFLTVPTLKQELVRFLGTSALFTVPLIYLASQYEKELLSMPLVADDLRRVIESDSTLLAQLGGTPISFEHITETETRYFDLNADQKSDRFPTGSQRFLVRVRGPKDSVVVQAVSFTAFPRRHTNLNEEYRKAVNADEERRALSGGSQSIGLSEETFDKFEKLQFNKMVSDDEFLPIGSVALSPFSAISRWWRRREFADPNRVSQVNWRVAGAAYQKPDGTLHQFYSVNNRPPSSAASSLLPSVELPSHLQPLPQLASAPVESMDLWFLQGAPRASAMMCTAMLGVVSAVSALRNRNARALGQSPVVRAVGVRAMSHPRFFQTLQYVAQSGQELKNLSAISVVNSPLPTDLKIPVDEFEVEKLKGVVSPATGVFDMTYWIKTANHGDARIKVQAMLKRDDSASASDIKAGSSSSASSDVSPSSHASSSSSRFRAKVGTPSSTQSLDNDGFAYHGQIVGPFELDAAQISSRKYRHQSWAITHASIILGSGSEGELVVPFQLTPVDKQILHVRQL